MEPRFGHDFSQVRVHTDAQAARSARAVDAQAYTVGQNVVFGEGRYAPDTSYGRELLAHELVHTLQQQDHSAARSELTLIAASDAAEQEASDVAAHVLGGGKPAPDVSRREQGPTLSRKIGDGHDLKSSRFAGDPTLEACYDGRQFIGTGASRVNRGPAVKKIQQALLDAGFPLPRYGADGDFGAETEEAVKAFQRFSGLTGRAVDGVIGPTTLGLLDQYFLPKETRVVPETLDVSAQKQGEVKKDGKVERPEVKVTSKSSQTVSPTTTPSATEAEAPFQFTGQIGVQNFWLLSGPAPSGFNLCDNGNLTIGGKWNWTGIPIGDKLTLFSEPELDVNVAPLRCSKLPGITLQDNILKWEITKKTWELALQGVFGLQSDWLKNWGDKPLTGQVGVELDWQPWANRNSVWYSGIKFQLNIGAIWNHGLKGDSDFWGLGVGQVGVGVELP